MLCINTVIIWLLIMIMNVLAMVIFSGKTRVQHWWRWSLQKKSPLQRQLCWQEARAKSFLLFDGCWDGGYGLGYNDSTPTLQPKRLVIQQLWSCCFKFTFHPLNFDPQRTLFFDFNYLYSIVDGLDNFFHSVIDLLSRS